MKGFMKSIAILGTAVIAVAGVIGTVVIVKGKKEAVVNQDCE